MARRVFDEDTVMTAICLWEAWLDFESIGFTKEQKGEQPDETYTVLSEFRGNHGSFTCRQLMIDIAAECDLAFDAAQALNGGEFDGAFDFDFCPQFLAGAAASGLLDERVRRQYQPRAA